MNIKRHYKNGKKVSMKKYVYMFSEGKASMRNLLGGKGANLCEMTRIGLSVPYGFVVSTQACNEYYAQGKVMPEGLEQQIVKAMKKVEAKTHKKLGGYRNPLLLSIRSGARVSMPGMMDTVLNLGMNDSVAQGMEKATGNKRLAYDSYRRLIQMYADVVKGLDIHDFEDELSKLKATKQVKDDLDLNGNDFEQLVGTYKKLYKKLTKEEFPQNPMEQVIQAIQAVFRSWNNERAIVYRRMNDIPSVWGTAVNVQMMVFGNYSENSGTGVAFTRNPATGEKKVYGEYLMNAKGEDVVSGVRTPKQVLELKEQNPEIFAKFMESCEKLENRYLDMQELEFTFEDNHFYVLQTRNGKRTAQAAFKIAMDLVKEKKITKKQSVLMIDPKSLDSLLHPTFDPKELQEKQPIATGLPASPGAGVGHIALNYATAKKWSDEGEKVILVKNETSTEDVESMHIVEGVLTATGGMTSHAAVVARGIGTPCVSGCNTLLVNTQDGAVSFGDVVLTEGDTISIDGTTGCVYKGAIGKKDAEIAGDFATIMSWAERYARIGVRANADTPKDVKRSLELGAEGIGLCRTEHMFFEEKRIEAIRAMILATTKEEREKAINQLLPMQQKDFVEMLRACQGKPLTIRFIDPPLHEFLPKDQKDIEKLAISLGKDVKDLQKSIAELKEFNPMMGYRGCRLAVVMPELLIMQTTAIIKAGIKVLKEGIPVQIEMMLPLIGEIREMRYLKSIIKTTADQLIEEAKSPLQYAIGTMIEVPRACMIADQLAVEADFYSFGTNDLTQMTYGYSRDDIGKFLPSYFENRILSFDPFVRVDEFGVGELMRQTIQKTNKVKKHFKYGVCGEQGADPKSVEFFDKIGLTYVSCSPYRVPIAKLASSQSGIKRGYQKR